MITLYNLCDDLKWLASQFRDDWRFFVKSVRDDIRALKRIRNASH